MVDASMVIAGFCDEAVIVESASHSSAPALSKAVRRHHEPYMTQPNTPE
jgi:hypothetical protein